LPLFGHEAPQKNGFAPTRNRGCRVLKARLITAALLAVIVVGAVYLIPPEATALLLGTFLVAAAWEWGALIGWKSLVGRLAYTVAIAILAIFVWYWNETFGIFSSLYRFAVVWWVVAGILIVAAQREVLGKLINLASNGVAGLVVLLTAWSAIIWLLQNDRVMLLSIFALVWVTDGAAFFVGKRWGKHRLASNVSPGKSWEGVAGGLVCGVLCGIGIGHAVVFSGPARIAFVAIVVLTILASVIGDLFESMLKRNTGVKDSGRLLPGHGGVLDRIDGMVAAAPVFVAGLHHWVNRI
jgi:phosphatidate cytidylyltransferase